MICWLDIEATGTDESVDDILEIGVVIALPEAPTQPVDGWSWTIYWHGDPSALRYSNPFVYQMHRKNGLLDVCKDRESSLPIEYVEETFCSLLAQHQRKDANGKPIPYRMAGNSVHYDLRFIRAKMPAVAAFFSHRIIDVSSLQEQLEMMGMPRRPKVEAHRALRDIREDSIPLFEYCRDWIASLKRSAYSEGYNVGFDAGFDDALCTQG